MEHQSEFVQGLQSGLFSCVAYTREADQAYRLVFSLAGSRRFTLQSDLEEAEEEIGYLVLEPIAYPFDARSREIVLISRARAVRVAFFSVEGAPAPSRLEVRLDTGLVLSVSSDAFPYALAYEIGDLRRGTPQYYDEVYRADRQDR